MGRYTAGGIGRDVIVGAMAGVAAIWVADKLDKAIYSGGSVASRRKSEAARPGGMDPAHILAKRAADAVGVEFENPADNGGGRTVHYGLAAGMGALYGLTRGMAPGVTTARGAVFGLAMFVLQDKIGNTALGIAGNPLSYPLRDHMRGAATYTLFGVMTDMVSRVLSPWRNEVVVLQGPPLSERIEGGRQYLTQQREQLYGIGRQAQEQGRQYVNQGIGAAGRLAEQVRTRLPDVDVQDVNRQGRRYAGQAADAMRTQVADFDAAGKIKAGRKQANRLVDQASAYIPDEPVSAVSRAMKRLFG